jgi:EF hand
MRPVWLHAKRATNGQLSDNRVFGVAFAPHCYRGDLEGNAYIGFAPYDTWHQGSSSLCVQTSGGGGGSGGSCTTNPETGQQTCSGGGGGGLNWNSQDCGYNNVELGGCASPILINPHSADYGLSGESDPVQFDLDADGMPDVASWTSRGSAVSFLAFDRNGNGVIDDGSELFGNHTRLPSGARAGNGFEVLAALDANGDGVIDAADPIWTSLVLWADRNHDGRCTADELQAIANSPLTAIEIDYVVNGRRDQYGNFFRYKGTAHLHNVPRPIYDVFFRMRQ